MPAKKSTSAARRKSAASANRIALCPAQQDALQGVRRALKVGCMAELHGGSCCGKTLVLGELQREYGGVLLGASDFLRVARKSHPHAIDDAVVEFIAGKLRVEPAVIVDDLDSLSSIFGGCGHWPRPGLFDTAMHALIAEAEKLGKPLVFGASHYFSNHLYQRSFCFSIDSFTVEDYRAITSHWLPPEVVAKLDFAKIHRFAPHLNARQLRDSSLWLNHTREELDTEVFIDYLISQRLSSNVRLSEVQAVDLHSLEGVDKVIRSLEDHIVLPFENDALATELGLKAKRGVLLHGPPGTGKTTVGRALAHRLRGKFFLIDGTFISGTGEFYQKVQQVFEAAKQNAPAVIFIDDADAIFENSEDRGLYRYLLTMLDGLEGKGSSRVCVMLTAMNLHHLPPALVRSGRVELWLEMCLPDAAARAAILGRLLNDLPSALAGLDVSALTAATEEFTGADLKHLVEDGKTFYAGAKARGEKLETPLHYFLEAVAAVRQNKQVYAAVEQGALNYARQNS